VCLIKDGIADKDDKCPTVAGPKNDAGGLLTEMEFRQNDKCPEVKGTVANKGCLV
jgi:hypothetical protein